MRLPLIGITMDTGDRPGRYQLGCDYASGVEKAGGIPFPIPYRSSLALIPRIVDCLAGMLFTGGDDLDPALYGQSWHPKAQAVDPERQRFELALLAEVEKRRLPTLGICLGAQVMNVRRGGSLHQFLPDVPRKDALEHRKVGMTPERHMVRLASDSLLARAVGSTQISVNTYHKQAVDRPGRGLRVVATAPDGVIEGLEDPSLPLFAAVQWHPERLLGEAEHLALFRWLVSEAANRSSAPL